MMRLDIYQTTSYRLTLRLRVSKLLTMQLSVRDHTLLRDSSKYRTRANMLVYKRSASCAWTWKLVVDHALYVELLGSLTRPGIAFTLKRYICHGSM